MRDREPPRGAWSAPAPGWNHRTGFNAPTYKRYAALFYQRGGRVKRILDGFRYFGDLSGRSWWLSGSQPRAPRRASV
jgi:hypothetical protein